MNSIIIMAVLLGAFMLSTLGRSSPPPTQIVIYSQPVETPVTTGTGGALIVLITFIVVVVLLNFP